MRKLSCLVWFILFLTAIMVWPKLAAASDEYPTKRIEFIVPTEAGGDGDILARKLLEGVSTALGQPIVVINKPGAAGAPGYREIHGAKPDGYTIGLGFPTLFMNKMRGLLPYDHHDFTLIAQHGSFTPVIVSSAKAKPPLKTIKDAVTYAKSHPGDLKFALSVKGGSWWVAGMIFQAATGPVFKNIPQEGSGAVVVVQLAGGHADLGASGLASALSQIEAGNLNILATFGEERIHGKYNQVPTLVEAGFDVTWDSPNFIIGPPKIPKNIVEKLVQVIKVEANKPAFKSFAQTMNATPIYRPSDQLLKYLDKQKEVSREILQKTGILKEK